MDGAMPATGADARVASGPGLADLPLLSVPGTGPRWLHAGAQRDVAAVAVWIEPEGEAEPETFRLGLVDAEGLCRVDLGRVEAESVIALWRDLSARLGLPGVLIGPDGAVTQPFDQIGRLALGPIRIRRRHAFLAGRRPRFLVRRKTARLPERPLIHRGAALSAPR